MSQRHPKLQEGQHIVNGFIVPFFIKQEEVDKLKEFTLYADDVWVVAYPKAGSTWIQQIVRLLRNGGDDDGKPLSHSVPWLEALHHMYPDLKVEDLPRPRTFQSHFRYTNMPCGLPSTTPCKYIYGMRNPKDVAVSYYHHQQAFKELHNNETTFGIFFEQFISGQVDFDGYFDHVLSWWNHRVDDNVLIVKYEDMKADLQAVVRKIASFIGQPLTSDVVDKIVNKATFDTMKKDPNANHSWTAKLRLPGKEPFMRRGVVGDWRNWLTDDQSHRVDQLYVNQLLSAGLKLDFLPKEE